MLDAEQDLLQDAIARNIGAVVSLPSSGMLRHYKTRFLGSADAGFYIESIPQESKLIDELIGAGAQVGMAFKSETHKIVFAVPILQRQPEFRVNSELRVEALLIPFPRNLKSIQRRGNYRVRIPANSEVSLQVWRLSEQAFLRDRPSATLAVEAAVRNLSLGGLAVLCPPVDGKPLTLANDQRLRIVLTFHDVEVLLEGRARRAQVTPDKSLRVGVQFAKLDNDIEGRQTLSKLTTIVGQLQREEVRRMRLGLSA